MSETPRKPPVRMRTRRGDSTIRMSSSSLPATTMVSVFASSPTRAPAGRGMARRRAAIRAFPELVIIPPVEFSCVSAAFRPQQRRRPPGTKVLLRAFPFPAREGRGLGGDRIRGRRTRRAERVFELVLLALGREVRRRRDLELPIVGVLARRVEVQALQKEETRAPGEVRE